MLHYRSINRREFSLRVSAMIGCALACRAPAQSSAPCPEPGAAVDAKFSPGQVWTYYSRETEPAATITVLKVETLPKIGVIVHIRLDGIRLHNCSSGPEPREIEHAPFTREALDRSVVKLIRTGEVPSFQEGYSRWRHDCGGVYTITVAEMVAADERTLNAGMGCHS